MNKTNKKLNLYLGCIEIFPNFFWKIVLKQSFSLQFYLIKKTAFVSILKILKFSSVFRSNLLVDLSITDFLNKMPAYFELVYIFRSIFLTRELSLFAPLVANSNLLMVVSATVLYENANWMEREMFDMFGICFENHVDLRRILTDYGFKGHPLRKDFPLSGFKEVKYNWKFKTLVSNNLELSGMRYV